MSELPGNDEIGDLEHHPTVWRSGAPVQAAWSAPAAGSSSSVATGSAPRRRWWIWLTPILAVAVVAALVAAFGGFAERHDALRTVPVGSMIDTGTYNYTFTKATAQKQDSSGKAEYMVVVYGTAQNLTDTGRAPSDQQFVGRDVRDAEIEDASGTKVGTSGDYTVGSALNPGLPPTPFIVEFTFKSTWQPSDRFRFAVANMTEEKFFLNEDQPHWENDSSKLFQMYLPMQTLAAKKY